MKNDYEIRGEVTAIIINSPKYGRKEALISTNKIDKANEFPNSWHVIFSDTSQTFYVSGHTSKKGNKRRGLITLHRWLTNAPENMVVDHIDHDALNNTIQNLRIVTSANNLQNRKGATKSSKSGVRGVEWNSTQGKWRARFKINKKNFHCGYYDTIEEAEQVAKEAREKHMPYSQEAII